MTTSMGRKAAISYTVTNDDTLVVDVFPNSMKKFAAAMDDTLKFKIFSGHNDFNNIVKIFLHIGPSPNKIRI